MKKLRPRTDSDRQSEKELYLQMGRTIEAADYRVRCSDRFERHQKLLQELIDVPRAMDRLEKAIREMLPVGKVLRYYEKTVKITAYYADAPWSIQVEMDGQPYQFRAADLIWYGEEIECNPAN